MSQNPTIEGLKKTVATYSEYVAHLEKLEKESKAESKRIARLEAEADPLDKKAWREAEAEMSAGRARVAALGREIAKAEGSIQHLGETVKEEVRLIGAGLAVRLQPHLQTLREDIGVILLSVMGGDKNLAYYEAARTPLFNAAICVLRNLENTHFSSNEAVLFQAKRIIEILAKLDAGEKVFSIPA